MANVSASTMAKGPTTRGDQRAYLRTLIPIGPESMVGWEERQGGNRHAAYREPGGLAGLADGLASAGCAHAGESPDAPPCKVQPGWSFEGGPARYFQRIEPARAGDAAAAVRAIVALLG
jgi:hypothetical protein